MTLLALVVLGMAQAWDEAPDVVMLGNSYTQFNTLEALVQQSLRDTVPALEGSRGVRLSAGGLWLQDHLARIEGGDARWRAAFSGAEEWDVVVLQDQSLLPGLEGVATGGGDAAYTSSIEAVPQLDAYAAGAGAETVLFMTWGRRDGDRDYFPEVYPDFETMNARLDAGTLAYAEHPSALGRRLSVAPVGRAFGAVYDRLEAEGSVPEAEGSAFHRLYAPDGSHPSRLGSGLAAGVFTATLTGHYPGVEDLPGVDASDAAWVADAIATAVVPFGDLWFPWALDWVDHTPPSDLDDAAGAAVVSGLLRCTAVGISTDVGAPEALHVGGTHGGSPGCGRLWVLEGGRLSTERVVLGADGTTGSFVVAGGVAEVASLAQPGGSTVVRDGVLSLSVWDGGVVVAGGTLAVSSGAGGASLVLEEGGTLSLVLDGAASPLRLSADSVLAGTVAVDVLPEAAEVVLVTAPVLATAGLQAALPLGWALEVESHGGETALLAVQTGTDAGDSATETGRTGDTGALGDAVEPTDLPGCGCGGGAPLGGVSLLCAGLGAARRRR